MQKRGCKAAFEFFSFGISPLRGGNLSFLKIFTHGGKFLELQLENCMLLNKITQFRNSPTLLCFRLQMLEKFPHFIIYSHNISEVEN